MDIKIPDTMKRSLAEKGVFVITEVKFTEVTALCNNILACVAAGKKEVTVVINSSGGSPTAAICFHEFVSTLSKEIVLTGVAVGECGSAALAMLLCCQRRKAQRYCGFFIHHMEMSLFIKVDGTEEAQIRKNLERSKKISQAIVAMQCACTGMSAEEWKALATKGEAGDSITTAEEALKYKIVHEVIDAWQGM